MSGIAIICVRRDLQIYGRCIEGAEFSVSNTVNLTFSCKEAKALFPHNRKQKEMKHWQMYCIYTGRIYTTHRLIGHRGPLCPHPSWVSGQHGNWQQRQRPDRDGLSNVPAFVCVLFFSLSSILLNLVSKFVQQLEHKSSHNKEENLVCLFVCFSPRLIQHRFMSNCWENEKIN